jgi:hypothetical protein
LIRSSPKFEAKGKLMNATATPRYLTKTRFKLAVECPTKLFYTCKPKIYADARLEDEFLIALAEGGFQVGELAKLMFSGGIEVTSINHEEAVRQTHELLALENITIFEAAICHDGLFARIDILRKSGEVIELIEVKAKSFDSTNQFAFRQKGGKVVTTMLPYLQDIAFQRHVMRRAFPKLKVSSCLMMADKSKVCSIDGLNQKFRIARDANGRSNVQVAAGMDSNSIGDPILSFVNVDDIADEILRGTITVPGVQGTLNHLATSWAEQYRMDEKIKPTIGSHCAKCEFRCAPDSTDLKSGLHECWSQALGWSHAQIEAGTVLDIWNFRHKQDLIDRGILRMNEVSQNDLSYVEAYEGLSPSQRQWMQISGRRPGGGEFYLDRTLIVREMSKWPFPLHFIDFETARVAIPFFAGQKPYANIAFQFSHHEMQADGSVAHKSQFLSTTPGVRPNYEFVRQLKKAIGTHGTVFMWWPHENTTLNAILDEIEEDPTPPHDADQIRTTILDLTAQTKGGTLIRSGKRAMVDLCRFASLAFFHPSTKGSSSIKKVLPAVMQASAWLKVHYSQPIYGKVGGTPSLNFVDQVWWQSSGGEVKNPYKLLPPVFTDLPQEVVDGLESDEQLAIAEGGAATIAFARLQFADLPNCERRYIEAALLRYCELDTLAMVMVYQAWHEWLGNTRSESKDNIGSWYGER